MCESVRGCVRECERVYEITLESVRGCMREGVSESV